jgi:predicted transcriptional regulator
VKEDPSLLSWIKMQMIFRILEDQKAHSTKEIARVVGLSADQASAFLQFLATYYIVTCDKEYHTVVINPEFIALR